MFKINDVEIARPTHFNITEEEISRKGRTASGKMFNEKIGVKNTFNLDYQGLRENKLTQLLELSGNFVSFSYMDLGVTKTKEVYFNPFSRNQFSTRYDSKGRYWEEVSIVLEEA